jgi:DNA-binding transcriptional LysR family regulator
MQKRYKGGMNLRHLHAFATVADAGGVARAATRLHVSQPALSRQIQGLEADLGVPLFDRIGRRVRLTSAGEDLLRRSRRLLAEADALAERARSLKTGETGILRIGTTPQVIENLLAHFLTHYRRRHPGVEVHLVEDGGVRLHGRLERGDVHLTMAPAGDMRFHDRLLYPMHLMAALPPGHRLSRGATLEVADLADEPLLLLRRDFASREWFDTACQVAHVRPRVLLESAAPHTLVALAASDYGIAILPSTVQVPRGVAPGSSREIARPMGRHRLGSAALPGPLCGAIRQGIGGPCAARLSGPRLRQARAADPATEGVGWMKGAP